jgi:hypothetical protein
LSIRESCAFKAWSSRTKPEHWEDFGKPGVQGLVEVKDQECSGTDKYLLCSDAHWIKVADQGAILWC